MPGKHLSVSLLLLFLAGCTTGKDKDAFIFQFQPDPGKLYQFVIKTLSTSESGFGITGDTISFRFDILPRNVDSTGTRVTMMIKELRLSKRPVKLYNTPVKDKKFVGMTLNYFLEQQQIMESLAGDSLVLLINRHGQLQMEDRLDDLIKHVSEKTRIDESHVKLVIRNFLSPSAMKDQLTELFFYLPVKHINQGDTWVSNTMLTALAPVKYSNMITVDTIENNIVSMNIRSRITAGGEGNIYMDGTRKGSLKADLSSGFPLNASFIDETSTRTTAGEIKKTRSFELRCTIK